MSTIAAPASAPAATVDCADPSGELRMASQRATFHQRRMSTIAAPASAPAATVDCADPSGELRMASQRATFHQRRMSTIAAPASAPAATVDLGKPRVPATDGVSRKLRALATRGGVDTSYCGATPPEILKQSGGNQTCRPVAVCGCRSVASTCSGVVLIGQKVRLLVEGPCCRSDLLLMFPVGIQISLDNISIIS
jgi:hypothetical protein